MPLNKTQVLRHTFGGGFASDYGPTVDLVPDQTGKVVIPFLVEAQDCIFELDGGPHEIGGTSKVNASAVASGAAVMGVYDYWRMGTAGTPSRRRVLHAGTVALADSDDSVFATTIGSGLVAGAVPSYFTFDDLLIFSSDAAADVPRSWDQTTAQALAGSPPNFSVGCSHKNRAWVAGNYAFPSRLYYSENVDPEQWTSSGAGTIDIDPNDGDMITGLASHKDSLFVFKGPNKGSIHRIQGSSPTGGDAFSRTTFVNGLGACWHNAIFHFADDLGFVSQYGTVHSLSSTAAYGDFLDGALSRPLNGWIKDHLNYARLRNIGAATDQLGGKVFITLSVDGSSTNNVVLVMDYRNAPTVVRWSRVPSYMQASLNAFVDQGGVRRILGGSNDGYVRRLNVADRSIDGTGALSFRVTTPFLNYGNPIMTKTISIASTGLSVKGNFNYTFGWTRDFNAQQTTTLTQSAIGAASLDTFLLDTSQLGGAAYVDIFSELEGGGEFRSIQYDVRQSGVSQDIELHSITAAITPGALSTELGLS